MDNKAMAILSWQLNTVCPHCNEDINLADPEYDADGFVPRCIFSNAWDTLKDFEVECRVCGKAFYISEVEYWYGRKIYTRAVGSQRR